MILTRRVFDEKRRLIVPLLIALVANVILFVAVVYPLSRSAAAAEASSGEVARALMVARLDYDAARATVSGKEAADAELARFYGTVLPADQSAARRLSYLQLDQLARKSGVTYERGSSDTAQEKDSTLRKLTTTAAVSGEYRDIRRFLHALETTRDFLILETVAVAQGSEGTSSLLATVKVATYYRAEADGD